MANIRLTRLFSLFLVFASACMYAEPDQHPLIIAVPGSAPITPNVGGSEATLQTSLSYFVRDAVEDSPYFRFMSENRASTIFKQIRSGALSFETDDLYRIFNEYYNVPVDVVIDFTNVRRLEGRLSEVEMDVVMYTAAGVVREHFPLLPGRYDSGQAEKPALKTAELLASLPTLPAAESERIRKFGTDRAKWCAGLYISEVEGNTPASCNGGAEASAFVRRSVTIAGVINPPLAAAFSRTAVMTRLSNFNPRLPDNREKHYAEAASSISYALGTQYENKLKIFIGSKLLPTRSRNELLELAEPMMSDREGRMLDEALSSDMTDDMDMPSDDDLGAPEKTKPSQGAKGDAQVEAKGRGALKALGWIHDRRAVDILCTAAKVSDPQTRRAVASAIGSYAETDTEWEKKAFADPKLLATLAKLASDKDDAVALTAMLSQRGFGIRTPDILRRARAVLDAKSPVTEGVIGRPAVLDALLALATDGTQEDMSRFRRFLNDQRVPVRREAVRGLFAKCDFTTEDIKLVSDPDESVGFAALSAIPLNRITTDSEVRNALVKAGSDPCDLVANAAREALAAVKWPDEATAKRITLDADHPYLRRSILLKAEQIKDAASMELLEHGTDNSHAQTRSLALKILSDIDAEKGRSAALKLIADPHTWVRCRAAEVLSRLARKEDGDTIATALKKETNRCAKLYFADALAKAEGRPMPTPPPSVNSILDGKARNWHCFLSDYSDRSVHNAYYTCDMPRKPTPTVKYAHDVLKKAIWPRPRPVDNPMTILTDTATMDVFWTELEKEMPDDVLAYVDGMVFGEETMAISPKEEIGWNSGWQLFCREAGIDPRRVEGNLDNLTADEFLAWTDFNQRVSVEGWNVLYDFTHFYFGKLRPGMQICTYMAAYRPSISRYQHLWKVDVQGTYIYSGDLRNMYTRIRWFRTMWPGIPNQWLAGGNVCGDDWHGAATWMSYYPPHPFSFRWDHSYASNLAVWLAGSETGYFSMYGIKHTDEKLAKPGAPAGYNSEEVYPGSFALTNMLYYGFYNVEKLIRDQQNAAKRAQADPADFDGDDAGDESVTLDEIGGTNDPAMVAKKELMEKARRAMLYKHQYQTDTARCMIDLPRQPLVWNSKALMLDCKTPNWVFDRTGADIASYAFGRWFEDYDVHRCAASAAQADAFRNYRFIGVGCGETERMDEWTRQRWIEWIRETPGLLVFDRWLDSGTNMYQSSTAHIHGNLVTPWPWHGDIEWVKGDMKSNDKSLHYDGRYVVKNSARIKVLEKDKFGVTRLQWNDPAYKATVIFDHEYSTASADRARELMLDFYKTNNVDMPVSDIPNRMSVKLDNGLSVEVRGWKCTVTNQVKGCELLTGQWDPILSGKLTAAMVADEFENPYICVHAGICAFSYGKMEVLEKLPNGIKVKPNGRLRITTRSGKKAKITTASGKPIPVSKVDPDLWYCDVNGNGIEDYPAIHVDPECPIWWMMNGKWDKTLPTIADREDNIPASQILRTDEEFIVITAD